MPVRIEASTGEKKIKGRKRHIATDTLGNMLTVQVHAANLADTSQGWDVCDQVAEKYDSIQAFCGDQGYRGTTVEFVENLLGLRLDITDKPTQGFQVVPKRWIIERTFAWLGGFRRLAKDFEIRTRSAENMIRIAMIKSYIQKLWMREKKSVSLSITMNPRGPSDEGERIRSMRQYTASEVETIVKDEVTLSLEALIRVGARRMLQAALEFEVDAYVENLQDERDEQGHRQVVKNGAHKPRDLLTGMGPIPIRQPRVHDRREGKAFRSAILPRYMRRAPSIDALIPALYLKGVSTSSFPEALAAILGEQAPGLSPANVVRLKQIWEQEYQAWRHRDLSDKHYVYVWADGIYFQVRLEPDRPCVLVIIGATKDGRKELLAIEDGHRESKLSWQNVLTDLKRRGLKEAPALAIGDGGLGFWAALEEVFPQTQHQRCWVHKSANVLDNLPKTIQAQAKARLHQMYLSPTRQDALGAYEDFLSLYEPKYPKACACLEKDKDVMFTFYDFPAAHWRHLRSTNPIESTFSTVRHRTRQTKGCGSRNATMMMVYKLADQAQKHWHRLHGHKLIELVVQGVEFQDGDVKAAA